MPYVFCVECAGRYYRLFGAGKRGTCSERCRLARHATASRYFTLQAEMTRRLINMAQSDKLEMRRLLRDLDGYVHSPCGFLSRERYEKVRAAHPDRGFPAYKDIPLMTDLSDGDLKVWYDAHDGK